jgi:CRISPR-associated protein Csd1
VEKGSVIADLVESGVLFCGPDQKLLTGWTSDGPAPAIFKLLTPKDGRRDQGDAFVRWRVQVPEDAVSGLWEDPSTHESWIRFDASQEKDRGLCIVTGERTALASNHPKRLRSSKDQAKLISSDDDTGYTFRGRFERAAQASSVGCAVSQKAHSALRWLIARQGYLDNASNQAFVAWSVAGKSIPDPFADTARLFAVAGMEDGADNAPYTGDAGQHFSLRLSRAIAGYRAKLGDADDIVVMGLGNYVLQGADRLRVSGSCARMAWQLFLVAEVFH